MNPMELLKKQARPLGVHSVATPELEPAGDVPEEEVQAGRLQLMAELSGEEMDRFVDVWSEIREKFSNDDAVLQDFKRAAIAFCWCDLDRNRFFSSVEEVWDCVKMLREHPSTLTTRMYAVANGANAFSGLDDETKKNSRVQDGSLANVGGSGA